MPYDEPGPGLTDSGHETGRSFVIASTSALAVAQYRKVARSRGLPWPVAWTIAFSAVALLLRLLFIDQPSLWEDEGYTLLFSRLPMDRLVSVAGTHEHPPLYYLLVHFVLAFKNSYLVPRLISAVAGALCVPLVYLLGNRVFNSTVGLLAAGIAAISPFQIWHGQNGRGYALACLFVLLSYLFLFRALDSKNHSSWPVYVLSTILALYTEYTTVLVLLPQVLAILQVRAGRNFRPLLASWIAIVLAMAPWAGVVLDNTRRVIDENYWVPHPSLQGVSSTALKFLGLMTDAPTMKPLVPYEVPVPLLTGHEVAALCVLVIGTMAVLWHTLRIRQWTLLILALWLILPFAVILLLSPVRSLYIDRIFLDATFPFYLLLAWLVWNGWTRHRALLPLSGLLALIIIGSVAADQHMYSTSVNGDWKSPMRELAAHYQAGQAVVFYPGVLRTITDAYLPAGWHATRELNLWTVTYVDVSGLNRHDETLGDDKLRRLELQHVGGTKQIWLVCDDYVGLWEVRKWFSDHHYRVRFWRSYAGWSDIELWVRS